MNIFYGSKTGSGLRVVSTAYIFARNLLFRFFTLVNTSTLSPIWLL